MGIPGLGPGSSEGKTSMQNCSKLVQIALYHLSALIIHGPARSRTGPGVLAARPRSNASRRWEARQRELVAGERWILDGDLGPYDALEGCRAPADAFVLLDFPLCPFAGRAF